MQELEIVSKRLSAFFQCLEVQIWEHGVSLNYLKNEVDGKGLLPGPKNLLGLTSKKHTPIHLGHLQQIFCDFVHFSVFASAEGVKIEAWPLFYSDC